MKLKIYALLGDKADGLQPFVRPEVWESPDRGQYWFLAATDEERPDGILGATVIDPVMPDATLLSIAVSPAHQHQGVATMMINRAIDLLAQAGVTGLRAICALSEQDWIPVRNLLTFNDFELEVESAATYAVPLGELLAHPMLAARPQNPQAVSLASLTAADRGSLAAILKKQQVSPAVIQECDPACSYVHRNGDTIDAMFLLGKLPNGSLNNLWTWLSTKSGSSRSLIDLFSYAFHQAAKSSPPETQVTFTCLNEASEKLLHHFLPDNTPASFACSYYTLTAYDDGEETPEVDTGYQLAPEDQLAASDDPAWQAFLSAPTLRLGPTVSE